MSSSRQVSLTPHPSLPQGPAQSIAVCVALDGDLLSLGYKLCAPDNRVRLPPLRAVARADELWRHTCFEAFLRIPGEGSYLELNFSPSGEWAAYRFEGYRSGMRPDPEITAPELQIDTTAGCEIRAQVPVPPRLRTATALTLGLAAVVESVDGTLSYWALRHAGATPDFHHPEGFMLELAQ